MRYAVEAFIEVDKQDAAHLVELAMHTRELAIKGVRNEKAEAVAKAAPNRGQLVELLGAASNLYEGWGKRGRSQALAELAKVYNQQWQRRQRAQGEGRESDRVREPEAQGLDSLERRLRILAIASEAYVKAGREKHARALANAVRYGRMLLGGSNGEALAKAAQGVPSKGNLIEFLRGAHKIWAEGGSKERAVACNQLAEYYAGQLRAQRREGGDAAGNRHGAQGKQRTDPQVVIKELRQQVERLQRELAELKAVLRKLAVR